MKKTFLFLLFPLLFFVACDFYAERHPTNKNGTIWYSEEPNMYFVVKTKKNHANYGFLLGENNTKFSIHFQGVSGEAYDINKFDEGYSNFSDIIVFSGKCKFSKRKFTITVTSSQIDSINVGDEIIFHRVEELPEWARELSEVYPLG